MRSVFDHLQTARRAVVRHALAADRAGFAAHEQALTEVVLTRAAPAVRVWVLNQREEARVGADWLWWWQGGGEWFGVLIQAKRHKPDGGKVWYDFDYRTRPGQQRQIDRLLHSARALGVPAAYVLYNHPPIPPTTLVRPTCCTTDEAWRVRLRVAVVSALLARSVIGFEDVVAQHARPIECLTCGRPSLGLGWTARALDITDPALLALLRQRELNAPRSVARTLLAQLAERRAAQFREAAADAPLMGAVSRPADAGDRIFGTVPDDRGHFGESYYDHVLRGLRNRPPDYVAAALRGAHPNEVLDWVGGNVDGLVVVNDAGQLPIEVRPG